jgi:hypothetical protein
LLPSIFREASPRKVIRAEEIGPEEVDRIFAPATFPTNAEAQLVGVASDIIFSVTVWVE